MGDVDVEEGRPRAEARLRELPYRLHRSRASVDALDRQERHANIQD